MRRSEQRLLLGAFVGLMVAIPLLALLYARGPEDARPIVPLLVGVVMLVTNRPVGEFFESICWVRGTAVTWGFRLILIFAGLLFAGDAVARWLGVAGA